MAEKGESASGPSVAHGLAPSSDPAGPEARTHYCAQCHRAAGLRPAAEAVPRLQTDALHRKRALAIGIVRHWAELVGISLLGSAWCAFTRQHACSSCCSQPCAPCRLSLVCFWTIRASVTMCDYVVSDKPRYNADVSIMEVRVTHATMFVLVLRLCCLLAGCDRAAAVPLDHEKLCVEPALVHVSVIRVAERGASDCTRCGALRQLSRQVLSYMNSCFRSYLLSTFLETGLHGLAGVRCAHNECGVVAVVRAQPVPFV